MKTLTLVFACVLAVSAYDFSNVRPIEDLLALHPEKYPLLNFMNRAPIKGFQGGRVVGGNEANPGQFPFQVALFVKAQGGTYFCGGSLLSDQYVMTAAHCVDSANSVEVVLGAHNVRENEETQLKLVVPKENVKYHEKWSVSTLRNDVAVLKLPTKVKFNDRVRPTVLPRKSDKGQSFANFKCTTSGWGKDRDSATQISPVLRFVETKVMANANCAMFYPGVVQPTHVCADGAGGKSSCNGDSGGPLTVEHEGKTKQVGVVSFGVSMGCAVGFPHAYTRVTEFLDWLEENTNVVLEP